MSTSSPGVFLQGLAVHGTRGEVLSDAALPPDVVAAAFRCACRCCHALSGFRGLGPKPQYTVQGLTMQFLLFLTAWGGWRWLS